MWGTVAGVEKYPGTRIGRTEPRLKTTMYQFIERVPFKGKTLGIIEEKSTF